ncbi:MAG: ABC transporter ATP-binding protein [Pirellulales bacterium]|nr:ABC transporter ATP-binding protein [Pirellulales bacterium]
MNNLIESFSTATVPPARGGQGAISPQEQTHLSQNTAAERGVRGPHARFPPAAIEPSGEHQSSTGAKTQLCARGLVKNYRKGELEIPVLRGVDLELRAGEFLSIIGQSGSGKSTLLHLLGTLDAPTAGEIHFWGHRIDNLPVKARDRLRNEEFGMVFQFYHLLPELTALENVLMPLMIRENWWNYQRNKRKYAARATELLEMVGLGHRSHHQPREMSGGEMQRTAIARALMTQPQVLLADEPTGNLDAATGEEILGILRTLNRTQNLSIIMVTHDQGLAARADRIIRLSAGRVELV